MRCPIKRFVLWCVLSSCVPMSFSVSVVWLYVNSSPSLAGKRRQCRSVLCQRCLKSLAPVWCYCSVVGQKEFTFFPFYGYTGYKRQDVSLQESVIFSIMYLPCGIGESKIFYAVPHHRPSLGHMCTFICIITFLSFCMHSLPSHLS